MPKSIQAAAKIKQQEDLAPQKIKAIKYLATVGCGCYQKMGVREALVDSLDDCTEEVRYEAAKALAKVAGTCSDRCGNTCCNAKVMNKLKELADGTDERCCRKESSERVRQAARDALNACKNKLPATNVTPTPDIIEKPRPKVEGLEAPVPIPPPPGASVPTPAPSTRPLDLPGDAPSGDPVPMSHAAGKVGCEPSVKKIDVQPVAAKTIQTSASTVPEAPIRLRLVIGGEAVDRSRRRTVERRALTAGNKRPASFKVPGQTARGGTWPRPPTSRPLFRNRPASPAPSAGS